MTHLDQLVTLFPPAVRRSNKTSMQNTYGERACSAALYAAVAAAARQLFDRYLIRAARASRRSIILVDAHARTRTCIRVCVCEDIYRSGEGMREVLLQVRYIYIYVPLAKFARF